MSSTTRHTVRFRSALIDTMVTGDAAVADEWVRRVRLTVRPGVGSGVLIVCLDCEWACPSAVTSKVATLQLCVGTSCLILRLSPAACVPASIRSSLGDPTVQFVGVGVGEDVAKLAVDYGLVCAAPVDLVGLCNKRIIGYGLRPRTLGLKGYARQLLGMFMVKPEHVSHVPTSDWRSRYLTLAQIGSSCFDAYVSYKLGELVLLN